MGRKSRSKEIPLLLVVILAAILVIAGSAAFMILPSFVKVWQETGIKAGPSDISDDGVEILKKFKDRTIYEKNGQQFVSFDNSLEKNKLQIRDEKDPLDTGGGRGGECGSVPNSSWYCTVSKDTTFVKGHYVLKAGIHIVGDDLTLDCNGSTIDGIEWSTTAAGLEILSRKNIVVKNCNFINYKAGGLTGLGAVKINRETSWVPGSDNVTLINNNISYVGQGIATRHSSNIKLIGNKIHHTREEAIVFSFDNENIKIIDNEIYENDYQSVKSPPAINIQSNTSNVEIIGNDFHNTYQESVHLGFYAWDVLIENNHFHDFNYKAIDIYGHYEGLYYDNSYVWNVTIKDNLIENSDLDGIRIAGNVYDVVIEKNIIRDIGTTSTSGHALRLWGPDYEPTETMPNGPPKDAWRQNFIVKNNELYNINGNEVITMGGGFIGELGVAKDIQIVSNIFENNNVDWGIFLQGGGEIIIKNNKITNDKGGYSTRLMDIWDSEISNNNFYNGGAYAINIPYIWGDNITVEGNYIEDYYRGIILGWYGGDSYPQYNSKVSKNIIRDVGYGIQTSYGCCEGITIDGNKVSNVDSWAGIDTGSDNYVKVKNNIVVNAVDGIRIIGDYATLDDNGFYKNKGDGIEIYKYAEFTKMNSNTACFNKLDINNDAKTTAGDDNTCDTTDGWNDPGSRKCTYDCNIQKIPYYPQK
jgi:parallel beta-helix repeat protein